MINTGIVGLKNAAPFINAMSELPEFSFKGIYDPCLLIDRPRQSTFRVFQSLGDLFNECDTIIFSIDDNLYHPLVCEAIRHSLNVFLVGVHNYQTKELNELLTLRDEAGITLHVGHPFISTGIFKTLQQICYHPLDVECVIAKNDNTILVWLARTELSLMLTLMRTSIHREAVNVYSSFSRMPDSIRVRLDFDNGAVGNISINRYGSSSTHIIKAVNYNNIAEADICGGKITVINSVSPETVENMSVAADQYSKLAMQLDSFRICLLNGNEPHSSIENEIRAQLACQRINEKMRINFNVF